MGFRHGRDVNLEWHRWVRAHEAELIAIGIPHEMWADRLTWWRFVQEGIHPPASNARGVRLRVSDLTDEQQRRLYQFLDRVLPEPRYSYSLWLLLQGRFGAAHQ